MLPPYLTVSGPGAGSDPRHPHIFTFTLLDGSPSSGRAVQLPEDRHRAKEPIPLPNKRKRYDFDLAINSITSGDAHRSLRGKPLHLSDRQGKLLDRDGLSGFRINRLPVGAPLLTRQLSNLDVRTSKDRFRRFVEIHQRSVFIDDENRSRDVIRQITSEDQNHILRLQLRHGLCEPNDFFDESKSSWPEKPDSLGLGGCFRADSLGDRDKRPKDGR